MNLLARILSHGFAIAIVLLLAVGFIHRGELFPGMPMPGFLGLDKPAESAATADTTDAEKAAGAESPEDTGSAGPTAGVPVEPAQSTTTVMAGDKAEVAPETESAPEPATATQPEPAPTDEPEPEPATGPQAVTGAAESMQPEVDMPVPAAGEAGTVDESAPATGLPAPAGQEDAADDISATHPAIDTTTMPAATQAEDSVPAGGTTDFIEAVDTGSDGADTGDAVAPAAPADPSASGLTAAADPGEAAEATAPDRAGAMSTGSQAALTEVQPSSYAAPPESAMEEAAPVVESRPVSIAGDAGLADSGAQVAMAEAPASYTAAGETLDMSRPYHVLAAAREAYWMHNYDEAESLYRRLIDLEPDNPDGYGELGNLYFSQGQWDDAAAAYFEAGSRLARSGHVLEAQNLLEVIRGLDGVQADELALIIDESR